MQEHDEIDLRCLDLRALTPEQWALLKKQVNLMGSEDFSFMLEERPGNIMLIGNGASAHVHHPAFDFNDDALAYGIAYFAQLIESGMAH